MYDTINIVIIKFLKKLKESFLSVLPITVIVVILNFSVQPLPTRNFISFIIGAILLIIGMSLYALGADIAIEPIGNYIGSKISETKKIPLILLVGMIIGFIVTIAEPDLTVLAGQVSIDSWTLILVIAAGVGLFMLFSVLRIILHVPLNYVLIAMYAIMFLLVAFVDKDLISLAFDSGGVTTGPITVPFIMALCVGIGTVLGGSNSQENSFGMVGICSVGPIIAVLVLALVFSPSAAASTTYPTVYSGANEIAMQYATAFTEALKEVGIALAPITGFFILLQFVLLHLPWKRFFRLCVGLVYTYIGLSVFLTGANVGFMPTGAYIGNALAECNPWLLLPIGMIVGAFIVLAEPAIHVLNEQVEEITNGSIRKRTMIIVMMISMAIALGLSMVRVLTGISLLWFVVPGYAVALILTFFVPKIFTGIAFDSGGVASGPMTATFVLPFSMGACEVLGGNVISDAFGMIALVALTPLITLQTLGLVYRIKSDAKEKALLKSEMDELITHEGEIISLDWQ